jgi:predicted transcriptional regulator
MHPAGPPELCGNIREEIRMCSRHIDVLYAVLTNQPIGIIKLANQLGLPLHQIRYSLRVLENCGYIVAGPTGANVPMDADEVAKNLQSELELLTEEINAFNAYIHKHNPNTETPRYINDI